MAIKEAAERLRAQRQTWSEEYRNTQQGSDEACLATEYLRLTDPTPIDEDWLRNIGFTDFASGMLVMRNEQDDCVAFMLPHCRQPFVQGRGVYGTKTRGQLRMLCAAMGIEARKELDK